MQQRGRSKEATSVAPAVGHAQPLPVARGAHEQCSRAAATQTDD